MRKWREAQSFVELALRINHHLPGYVDAYFGPPEIRAAVEAQGKAPLSEMTHLVKQIKASLGEDGTLPDSRKEYLEAELNAMSTTLRILSGEEIQIREEAEGLYNLKPVWTSENEFDDAQQALNSLFPGSLPLAEKMEAYREKIVVPKPTLQALAETVPAVFRERTKEILDLPQGETCNYAFVTGKSWLAYNWYLGKHASRIEINLDVPIYVSTIPDIFCHEAYPGHHTEHAVKERELYERGGCLEFSVLLNNTPSAVISEGIAEVGAEIILSPAEMIAFYGSVLQQAGIKGIDGEQIYQIGLAYLALSKISINIMLLHHAEGASDEEVIQYGMRYGLISENIMRHSLNFLKDPLWRSYTILYPMGYDLIKGYIGTGADRVDRFLRLLHEPATPSQLMAVH